jgi:hypothetical protein
MIYRGSYIPWVYRGFVYSPHNEVEEYDDNMKIWHYVTLGENGDIVGYIEYSPYRYLLKEQFQAAIEYMLKHKTHESKAFTELANLRKIEEDI